MSSTTPKTIWSCIGEFRDIEGRRKFVPDSPHYYIDRCAKQPLNKKYTCTFSTKIATRSEQQLAYHFVLMEYLSEHTGYQVNECHDLMMRLQFGTKTIKIGKYQAEVRESISNRAKFPKYWMVDLITKDLEVLADLQVAVPTAESLGYISNTKPIR